MSGKRVAGAGERVGGKASIRVIRRSHRILELPNGWLNKDTGRTYKTATGAFTAAKREAKTMAEESGGAIVTILEWDTKTPVGRAIAKSFA